MVSWNFQGLLPYFLSPTFPLGSSFSHTHHTLNNASQELRVCGCVKPQVPGSTPRNRGRGHQSLGTSISSWPSNRGLSWVTVTEIMNSILNCRLGPTTPLEGTVWGGAPGERVWPNLGNASVMVKAHVDSTGTHLSAALLSPGSKEAIGRHPESGFVLLLRQDFIMWWLAWNLLCRPA